MLFIFYCALEFLHLKTFYGTTKNVVFTQIWIAIYDYLLFIIAKKHYMLNPSLHSIRILLVKSSSEGKISEICLIKPTSQIMSRRVIFIDSLRWGKISLDSNDLNYRKFHDKIIVKVESTRGEYNGQGKFRSYEIELPFVKEVSEIYVNGKKGKYIYDKNIHGIRVLIQDMSIRNDLEVIIIE